MVISYWEKLKSQEERKINQGFWRKREEEKKERNAWEKGVWKLPFYTQKGKKIMKFSKYPYVQLQDITFHLFNITL